MGPNVRVHEDLVISGARIHEAEEGMACCGVNKLVDVTEREAILGTCAIEVSVVYTCAIPFSIC